MNEYEKIFLKFPYMFSKTTLSLYLYKLYNRVQHRSEFHQIIKHFYNFLKSQYKI